MSDLEPKVDAATLREVYADGEAVRVRIAQLHAELRAAPDEIAELVARGDLVDVLRGVGELDEALIQGQRAVDRAELAGARPQQHLARVRLATVRQVRGEFAESNVAFTELVHAAGQFGPVIAAFTNERAGKNAYDQRDYVSARDLFTRSLALRQEFELPGEQIASAQQALDAVSIRLQEDAP